MYTHDDFRFQEDWQNEALEGICPFTYMLPYMPPFSDYDDINEEDTMRQPYSVARLLQSYETQYPQSFTQLEKYKIPRFFLRRVFRSVIGYVLQNVNIAEPLPQPANQYAVTLFNQLISKQPMYTNVFTFFGVPYELTRNTLITLIRFVLSSLPFPGSGGQTPALITRIVRMVETTTNIPAELAKYNTPQNQARTIIRDIVQFVARNAGAVTPQNIELRATELTNLILRTDAYTAMTSKGVPGNQAKNIIRQVVMIALREMV